MKFYPSGENFTQALLVMLVTNFMSAKTYPSTTSSYCFAILLDSEQKLQQYDTLVTLNTNTLSFIANQIINFK